MSAKKTGWQKRVDVHYLELGRGACLSLRWNIGWDISLHTSDGVAKRWYIRTKNADIAKKQAETRARLWLVRTLAGLNKAVSP